MNFAEFIARLRAHYWRIIVGVVAGLAVAAVLFALTPRTYTVARDVKIDLIDPNTSMWQVHRTVTPGMTAALRAIADNADVINHALQEARDAAGHDIDVKIELKQFLGTATIRIEASSMNRQDAGVAVDAMVDRILPIRDVVMDLTPYELTVRPDVATELNPSVHSNPNLIHTLFGGAMVFGVAGIIWALWPMKTVAAGSSSRRKKASADTESPKSEPTA